MSVWMLETIASVLWFPGSLLIKTEIHPLLIWIGSSMLWGIVIIFLITLIFKKQKLEFKFKLHR